MTNDTSHHDLIEVAKRVNWFDPPEELVKHTKRFLCYFMQYCLTEDIAIVKKYFTLSPFRHALDDAPPGILDARSRAYWSLMLQKK